MTALAILAVMLMVAVASLIALRWHFQAQAAENDKQRAHELAVRVEVVKVDQAALDEDRAKLKQLQERVKTLEYRPQRQG